MASSLNLASIGSRTSGRPPIVNDSGSTEVGQFCRAWVNFNGTGTVAIRDSFNVSSITDNNTGDYTVNFTNAMPNANYAVNYSGKVSDNTTREQQMYLPFSLTTSTVRLHSNNASATATDNALNFVSIYADV